MELRLFDEVGDLVRSMTPSGLGEVRIRAHRRGVKVWFGPAKPTKEHYEAQFVPSTFVDGADGQPVVEVGFHSEHPEKNQNDAVLERLLSVRSDWGDGLGGEVDTGPFLGNDTWRRISETWIGIDAESDPELAFELAGRLVDYIAVLEPIRQSGA